MANTKSKVTLETIAAETGLSKYAVSRAISGKSGVSEVTRERVLEACRKLGYERKVPAVPEHQYIIFVIPEHDAQDTSFWMRVMLGIESSLTANGYALHVLITTHLDDRLLISEANNCAGIIFAGNGSLPYIDTFRPFAKPMMVLTYAPYNLFPYDTMHFSDREGAYALCKEMITRGHKKIAYYGALSRPSMKKRYDGIEEAATDFGASIVFRWDEEAYPNRDDLIRCIRELKEAGELPSIVICSTDAYAMSLIYALNNVGISVPEDISVTGFNTDLGEPSPIPLTSIGFNKKEYGKIVVHYLLDRIHHPEMPPKRISIVPQLVLGKTTRALV